MGLGVIKLGDDQYIGWSTISEQPTTNIMTRAEALQHFGEEDRIARADERGTSFLDVESLDDLICTRNKEGARQTIKEICQIHQGDDE
jgi:hypothetical protein